MAELKWWIVTRKRKDIFFEEGGCFHEVTSSEYIRIVHMDSQVIIMQTFFLQEMQPDMQVFLWGSEANSSGSVSVS